MAGGAGTKPSQVKGAMVDYIGVTSQILEVKPDELRQFTVTDTFNDNVLTGVVCRKSDYRYGTMVIFELNEKRVPHQVIYGTPKLEYPFDRNGVFHWPKVNEIEAWDKLDGTNIFAYRYMDGDKNKYLTYKTRLGPVVSDTGFGSFLSMWKEMLMEKENIKDLTGLYNKLREDMAKSNDSVYEDTGGFSVEGMVLYAHTGGPSLRMLKCKPEQIEKIHWAESEVIQRIELWNTAINAFEDIEPNMDYLIGLLKEEYTEKMIYKSRERINRIFRDVTEHMRMVKKINEIWTLAKEKGFDITKNKAETLGFVSQYFSKKEMKKVGSVILTQAGLI